tara:strand:- start:2590 stop:2844 length:255 start_codon:yes stop_codon:yes gene_type:complete
MSEVSSKQFKAYIGLAGTIPLLASAVPIFEFVIGPYQEQIVRLEEQLKQEKSDHEGDRVRWESNRIWLLNRNSELMNALGVNVE